MPPVHRPYHVGAAIISVRLLEEIEATAMIDCAPPPGVIASLVARVQAERDAWRNPELNDELVADACKTLDSYGTFLNLEEIYHVQQLRGWHRVRHGSITVDAGHLSQVRNLLDSLTLSTNDECEEVLAELDYPGAEALRAKVSAAIKAGQPCDECEWCIRLRLRDECDAVLDAAGHDGGSRYRAYCQKVA